MNPPTTLTRREALARMSVLLGGALIGTSRESAAIGAAVGAAGGFLYDQVNQRQDTQSENARLRQENEALRQQQANQ